MDKITFEPFPKIPRLYRDITVTEKIDGTNAQIIITEERQVVAASRKRIITSEADNFGFATWVQKHREELLQLGPGRHYGEWWGQGIQRGYGLSEKRFSLFNTKRWLDSPDLPECCSVVPFLHTETFNESIIKNCLQYLRDNGSLAAPGYQNPEGIVVYHHASNHIYKVLLENDHLPKGNNNA